MVRFAVGAILVLSSVVAGCGSNAGPTGAADAGDARDTSVTEEPPDLAPEGPVDAPADVEAGPSPIPATFVLTNGTTKSIYIQVSGLSGQGYWSLSQGGKRLTVSHTCEVCACSECPYCALCGRSLGRVKELKPGEQHQWSWDGRDWALITNTCQQHLECEQDQAVPRGAELQLDVTYSYSFAVDPSFGGDDQFIGAALVTAATFTHPPATAVELVAEP
jgi:hypothetical protein